MDTVFYGFLLGIGQILALLTVAAFVLAIALIVLFASYISKKGENRGKERTDDGDAGR